MHIQGNGRGAAASGATNSAGSAGIVIDQGHTISICGNHLEGNGGDIARSSQVYFVQSGSHVSDNVTFCGNVYEVENLDVNINDNADVTPAYVYDADSNLVLTNTHFYETAEQPAVSIFSPNAQNSIQPLVVPQFTQNQLSGLALSNDSPNSQKVDVKQGSAADSTNSTIIQLSTSCTLDLGKNGAGGLDIGNVAPVTTYYIFIIAPVSGGSEPATSCMASTSLTPQFTDSSFTGTGYQLAATGGAHASDSTVYNVNPLAGAALNDDIWSVDNTAIPLTNPPNTIQQFTANSAPMGTVTGQLTDSSTMITNVMNISNVQVGMALRDASNGNCIAAGTYITGIVNSMAPFILEMSNNAGTGCNSDDTLSISGARQIVLNTAASTTEVAAGNLLIGTGYYRMIGALYTDGNKDFVNFAQDGNTFYLTNPVQDINTHADTPICQPSIGTTATTCALSVPCGRNAGCATPGIKVEAFGRMVGGTHELLLSIPDQSDQAPTDFTTSEPGYDVTSTSSTTSYPFHLYTNGSGQVRVRASGNNTNAYEVTDGWILDQANGVISGTSGAIAAASARAAQAQNTDKRRRDSERLTR